MKNKITVNTTTNEDDYTLFLLKNRDSSGSCISAKVNYQEKTFENLLN